MQRLSQLLKNFSVHNYSKLNDIKRSHLSLCNLHQKLIYINKYREFSISLANYEEENKDVPEDIFKYPLVNNFDDVSIKKAHFNKDPTVLEGTNECLFLSPCKINVLAPPDDIEDVEFIAPELKPTFHLAAYVDKSETLKHFIKLGVEIAKWEKNRDICIKILRMDFEKEIKPFIFFLNDIGIPAEDMGQWLTKNPQIFQEIIENLYTRIIYLESKKFSQDNIATIVKRVPLWINSDTITIDKELGIYQRRFNLTGDEVRHLVVADPKLMVYTIKNNFHLERICIALKDELGFTKSDTKTLLLKAPRIYRTNVSSLFRRFDVIHHEMGLTHEVMTQFPNILLCRDQKLSERHQFLKYLNKNQYNPEKPNYVSPIVFIKGVDGEFCVNVAGTSTDVFNDFLKTL